MSKEQIQTSPYSDMFIEGDIDNVISYLQSCKRQCKEQGWQDVEILIVWNHPTHKFRLFGNKA